VLKRIDHVGVIVDDLERVSRIFSEVLGMELSRSLEDATRGLRARFYRCGDVDVELIELSDPVERARRLGDAKARIEHVAFEAPDLAGTAAELGERGVRMTSSEPQTIGPVRTYFTEPDSTGGVVLQFLERLG
jgi:methylmalonyl-CoA/ethylmalonyl-CoA epimerase